MEDILNEKKPPKPSKPRSSVQRKDYQIGRRFFVVFDEQNPLVRHGQMEANAIPGTMTHYCYSAVSSEGRIQIRKYSCYCRSCSKKQYALCIFVGVVRTKHAKLMPAKKRKEQHGRAMATGWVEYEMTLKDDVTSRETRQVSAQQRDVFASGLRAGSVVAVYCGGQGAVDHSYFWLAEVAARKKKTSKVTYKATKNDPNWDIKKGVDTVLNVRWLERTADDHRVFVYRGGTQTISLECTLLHTVVWESTNQQGKKKATHMRLPEEKQDHIIGTCKQVKVLKDAWELKETVKDGAPEESEQQEGGHQRALKSSKRKSGSSSTTSGNSTNKRKSGSSSSASGNSTNKRKSGSSSTTAGNSTNKRKSGGSSTTAGSSSNKRKGGGSSSTAANKRKNRTTKNSKR